MVKADLVVDDPNADMRRDDDPLSPRNARRTAEDAPDPGDGEKPADLKAVESRLQMNMQEQLEEMEGRLARIIRQSAADATFVRAPTPPATPPMMRVSDNGDEDGKNEEGEKRTPRKTAFATPESERKPPGGPKSKLKITSNVITQNVEKNNGRAVLRESGAYDNLSPEEKRTGRLTTGRPSLSSSKSTADLAASSANLMAPVSLKRDERLRQLMLQERELDALLTRIRKEENDVNRAMETERKWEKAHPISANLVVQPNSSKRDKLVLTMVILVVVSAIFSPVDVAYSLSSRSLPIFFFQLAIDLCFLVDLVFGFRTALVDSHNYYTIKRPAAIAAKYLCGWFWVDLVAAMPIDAIMLPFGSPKITVSLLKLMHTVRLTKLPRLIAGRRELHALQLEVGSALLSIFGLLLLLALTFHLLACLYILIVRIEALGEYGEENQIELNDWLPPGDFLALDSGGRVEGRTYVFALWWSMTAICSAATPTPYTMLEGLVGAVVAFLGLVVNGFFVGLLASALSHLTEADGAQQEQRQRVEHELNRREVPAQLRRRILQFFNFSGTADAELFALLPSTLRKQLDLVDNRTLFLKVPFLANCDATCASRIVAGIRRDWAWPETSLLDEGSEGRGFFLVARGFLRVSVKGQLQGLLTRTHFFGEASLVLSSAASSTVQTITLTEFLHLNPAHFTEVLAAYPQLRAQCRKFTEVQARKDQRLKRARLQLQHVRVELEREWHMLQPEARQKLQATIVELEESVSTGWLQAFVTRVTDMRRSDQIHREGTSANLFNRFRRTGTEVMSPRIGPVVPQSRGIRLLRFAQGTTAAAKKFHCSSMRRVVTGGKASPRSNMVAPAIPFPGRETDED